MGNSKRYKILIADDSEMNRSILADMLGDEYDIIEAEDGSQAVAILQKHSQEISLVLLDIVMPEMDGFEVLAMMNRHRWIEDVPVIMISAEAASSYVERAYELGVTDYISRPFDDLVVHRRVINTIMLYAKQKKLVSMVADQIYEKEKNSNLMINILSHIVEFRNGESGLHVLHVQTITGLLLKHLIQITDKYKLTPQDINTISVASALHDIGKIAIPGEILNKPGKLTLEEFEIMKTHSAIGASMLEQLPFHQEEAVVKIAYQICRWHHERYNGRGYPDRLEGDEIPIAAQVVALADVYDALTSERVYKRAYSHEVAIQMILDGECGSFNPVLLQCLQEVGDTLREELKVASPSTTSRREMRSVTLEMMQHEELSASERTLRLLEHERTKYQFFASMSREIQFEYTADPPMVNISSWGARQLGVKEIISDPLHDGQTVELFGGWASLDRFIQVVRATTPEQPVGKCDLQLNIGGEPRWYHIICRSMWSADEPPQYTGIIGKATDVHEEHTRLTDLERQATHDGLTGLLNHASVQGIIEERLRSYPERNYALFLLDLDYFKTANDQYGHLFGDKVLRHLADKLQHSIRGNDFAARVGGDEFLVFLEYKSELPKAVNRIFNALGGEFEGFRMSISMGVTSTENCPGGGYEDLLHQADQALYTAKRAGRGQYRFYDDTMKNTLSEITPIDGGSAGEESPEG